MIKLNKSENARTLVVTYPRTIEIISGVYDNIADIENFKIQIKNNINDEISYKTNVKGGMTDWRFFVDKDIFIRFMNFVINQNKKLDSKLFHNFDETCSIRDAWGNALKKGDYVALHKHPCYHGILYLTEGNPLIFPELDIEINPTVGSYYIFPPEVLHYVNEQTTKEIRYNVIFNIFTFKV